MGVPSPTGVLAVVSGSARPLRYQTAGTLRQALRWTREDLQSGTERVSIKGDDLTPLLAALADVGRRFSDAATVELSRYEVGFGREHIGLVAELEARAPRIAPVAAWRGGAE